MSISIVNLLTPPTLKLCQDRFSSESCRQGAPPANSWFSSFSVSSRRSSRHRSRFGAITHRAGRAFTTKRLALVPPLAGDLTVPVRTTAFRTARPPRAGKPVEVAPSTPDVAARTSGTRTGRAMATLALCASTCTKDPQCARAVISPVPSFCPGGQFLERVC